MQPTQVLLHCSTTTRCHQTSHTNRIVLRNGRENEAFYWLKGTGMLSVLLFLFPHQANADASQIDVIKVGPNDQPKGIRRQNVLPFCRLMPAFSSISCVLLSICFD